MKNLRYRGGKLFDAITNNLEVSTNMKLICSAKIIYPLSDYTIKSSSINNKT
jgi:hypothetical protein